MHTRNRAQGWGQSPEPFLDSSEDEYGGTHGIDQAIAPGLHWTPIEAPSDDSSMCIDPSMLGNPRGNSLSDECADGDYDFEFIQDDSETNSTL
ncbi:hypothetical protein PG995_004830 [Apiospora arundinis]